MPISDQTTVFPYTGNGVTTTFAYSCKIFATSDLKVTVDGVLKTLTTDYSVTGVGVDGGGNVVFVAAPANLSAVTIYRDIPYSRATDYMENGDLKAQTLDDDLDRETMLIQQLRRDMKRSIKGPIEDTTDQAFTDTAASRANKVLAFDATGAPKPKSVTDISSAYTSVGAGLQLVSGDLSMERPTLVGTAGGTVDVITCTVTPAPAALSNGIRVLVRASGANTSATPTFNLNSLGAKTIVKGSNAALLAADIPGAGFWTDLVYDSTLDRWVIQNPHKKGFRGVLVYKTADQSIPNGGGETVLTWDAEQYDTDALHDNVTNNDRLVVPAGVTRVRPIANIRWAAATAGTRQARILKNSAGAYGLPFGQNPGNATVTSNIPLASAVIDVAPGDFFSIFVWQDSGSPVTIRGDATDKHTWFALEIIE